MKTDPLNKQHQAVLVQRVSGIAGRLREKLSKSENLQKAIGFAQMLRTLGLKTTKAMHLSIMKNNGVNSHEARAIARDAKKRKPRKRSR